MSTSAPVRRVHAIPIIKPRVLPRELPEAVPAPIIVRPIRVPEVVVRE